ncbi:hypothetical protein HY004_00395 [Candidatus Saccharibacteria bacterium]|nr:hypothetical protein [Candidatus Saccharibacteria bacterium]
MTVFKKQFVLAVIAVCVFSLTFLPTNVLAIESQSTTTSQTTTKEAAARQARAQIEASKSATTDTKTTASNSLTCQSINKLAANIQNQLTEKKSKIDSKRIDIYVKSTTRRETRDAELLSKRDDFDSKRQQNFEKLKSMAKTDEQTQAVEVYISAITKATQVRRDANDAAFATFRSDVDSLKKTAGQSTDANASATSASINQAISQAKADCASGQSADTVKQTLKTAIDAARQKSKISRESVTKGDQLKAIVQKRNDALKANAETFRASTAAARDQLKNAFNQ